MVETYREAAAARAPISIKVSAKRRKALGFLAHAALKAPSSCRSNLAFR
jgi:hypothetical protein